MVSSEQNRQAGWAGAGAGARAGAGVDMCKAAAPSSFALISLISVMRAASSAAANAAATGRNDAAAAVPMTARRPSGRAGVWSAEVPTSSVTARVVSMKTRPEPSAAPRASTKALS